MTRFFLHPALSAANGSHGTQCVSVASLYVVRRFQRALMAVLMLAMAACMREQDSFSPPPAPVLPPPEILASTVLGNANNALSALVSVRVRLADSVVVRYGTSVALDSATPAVLVHGDSAIVPVFGLLPSTPYYFRIVAHGGQAASGGVLTLTTDSLPGDLPRFVAGGEDPSPGYVVFAAGQYGLVIDNSGRVVWYHRFAGSPGLNFKAEPTGHYFARPPSSGSNTRPRWVEIDALGNLVRTLSCVGDMEPRFHDLIAEANGSYWIMCDDVRTMNLSALGGHATAKVTGTAVQHVSDSGELLFHWSPFDHFEIADLDPASRNGATVNWTHGNSLDLDANRNLVVSFRNLNELTKIDTRTGAVLWRMGGLRNQFAFQDSPALKFSFQHAVRWTSEGDLLFLDNLGDPTSSRVLRYNYEAGAQTARLVGSYRPVPDAVSQTGGSVQELPGGRTLVSFGPAGRVEEYDATGRVVWRIEGNPGYVFRAQRIQSLYRPGIGLPR